MIQSSDLSQALALQDVRVNGISPGRAMTEDSPWTDIKGNMTPLCESRTANIPIGLNTIGEKLARAFVFGASLACKAIAATIIALDDA